LVFGYSIVKGHHHGTDCVDDCVDHHKVLAGPIGLAIYNTLLLEELVVKCPRPLLVETFGI